MGASCSCPRPPGGTPSLETEEDNSHTPQLGDTVQRKSLLSANEHDSADMSPLKGKSPEAGASRHHPTLSEKGSSSFHKMIPQSPVIKAALVRLASARTTDKPSKPVTRTDLTTQTEIEQHNEKLRARDEQERVQREKTGGYELVGEEVRQELRRSYSDKMNDVSAGGGEKQRRISTAWEDDLTANTTPPEEDHDDHLNTPPQLGEPLSAHS